MKFSKQWIQEYVDLTLETEPLVHLLTMAGLEVDGTETTGPLSLQKGEVANTPDTIIEIDLTPNRGDCLSIQGIAREIAVLNQQTFMPLHIEPVKASLNETVAIKNEAPSYCARYVGRLIKRVNNQIKTPDWMVECLNRSNIRSINAIVDILNFVMLELGQPMHAFDKTKLSADISIRLAKDDELITLLDEQKIKLKSNTLVIADDTGPVAIAGIMGGLNSSVTPETHTIFLESALFLQATQAGKARQYGLQTDSSYRFERGVDPTLQVQAIERASKLILDICGGELGPVQEIVENDYLPHKEQIVLRTPRIQRMLGIAMAANDVIQLLSRIGCQCQLVEDKDNILVLPPVHRYDLNIEVDLIEELARIYGYQNIKTELPTATLIAPKQNERQIPEIRIKQAMVDMGYCEAINYSFTDSRWQQVLFPEQELITLLNPISQDMDTMRVSLLPGLLQTLQHNLRRQQHRIMVFELGNRYLKKTPLAEQTLMLAGMCVGKQYPDTWRKEQRSFDFFDVKGHLEALWQMTGKTPLRFKVAEHHLNQKGNSAELWHDNQLIGICGKFNPTLQKELDIEGDIYWFECQAAPFLEKIIPQFVRPSKFPEIRRDIAVIVDNQVLSEKLIEYVGSIASDLLQKVHIFDEYKGKGIAEGRKSIALGLILQHPSRTLVDEEVNTLMQSIVNGLKKDFAAELRE